MDEDIKNAIVITAAIVLLIFAIIITSYVNKISNKLDNLQNNCIDYDGSIYCKK